jgi:ZIP family zinc transporter
LLISLAIAAISMISTVIGYGIVSITSAIMPFILATAGGAMLYVVGDEMIPETHAHGHEKLATFSLVAGFMVTLFLQKMLG